MACKPPTFVASDRDADLTTDTDTRLPDSETPDADQRTNPYDGGSTMGCTKVDILFVVDRSASMFDEAHSLTKNFPLFIENLEKFRTENGQQLDYRVGMTSATPLGNFALHFNELTDHGPCVAGEICGDSTSCLCQDSHYFDCSSRCSATCSCYSSDYIGQDRLSCNGEDGRLTLPENYYRAWIDGPGSHVAEAFSPLWESLRDGCGLEMPLHAVYRAFSPEWRSSPGERNEGFLRPDALLLLIILTDEDDCSTGGLGDDRPVELSFRYDPERSSEIDNLLCTDVDGNDIGDPYLRIDYFLGFLDEITGHRSHFGAVVIAGDEGCGTAAAPAHRLRRFVAALGENGSFSNICDENMADSLSRALETLNIACEDYILY